MVPLIDSIRSYTSNYFSNKTANLPPVTQCSNGEGADLVKQMEEAGVTGIQVPFSDGGVTDATMCYESGVCTNPDDAGTVGQYPANDAGALKLPDDVSQPVKDPSGNEVQRFTEAYPRIVIMTGNLSGSGLQNESIVETVFGTDSTLIGPTTENPNIPKMPSDPNDPALGSFPGMIEITPAQTIGGETQACTEQPGYEGFALCPWWDGASLPLLVDLYLYICYDKFDQNGKPVGDPIVDTGYVTVDPPAPLGTMPWGMPGPDAYKVVHPHACYHSDSGRVGNLAAVIEIRPLVNVQQANESSIYQTWFWARTFSQK